MNGVTTEEESVVTDATFINYYSAKCALPELPASTEGGTFVHGWSIALSNNGGATYSQPTTVKVIDSQCHTCDIQNTCTISVSVYNTEITDQFITS